MEREKREKDREREREIERDVDDKAVISNKERRVNNVIPWSKLSRSALLHYLLTPRLGGDNNNE